MSLAHNGHSQLVGLEHRRGEQPVAVRRPEPARQAGDCRDEPVGHHGGRLASVEGIDDAGGRAVEGADHRVALGRARARQRQPQPGRRAADGAEAERRRRPDRGVRVVREGRSAGTRGSACGGDGAAARGVRRSRRRRRGAAAVAAGAAAVVRRGGGAAAGGGRRGDAAPCPVEQPNAPAGAAAAAAAGGGGRGAARRPRRSTRSRPSSARSTTAPRRRSTRSIRPRPRATVKDFVDHIDYVVKLIGIDHVGISSDFDGGGGVDGWNSAAETFNVTLELVRRGYTEEQIGKIWSGNLLRVWGESSRSRRGFRRARSSRELLTPARRSPDGECRRR